MLILGLQQLGHANKIISRKRQSEGSIHARASAQLDFGQTRGTLDPAEYFFDAFAAALADVIADVTRGAGGVDRRLAPLASLTQMSVDRDMRSGRPVSQVAHELADVIGLVRSKSDALRAPAPVDQWDNEIRL